MKSLILAAVLASSPPAGIDAMMETQQFQRLAYYTAIQTYCFGRRIDETRAKSLINMAELFGVSDAQAVDAVTDMAYSLYDMRSFAMGHELGCQDLIRDYNTQPILR